MYSPCQKIQEGCCFVTKRCAGVFTEDASQVTSGAVFICSGKKTCSCPPRLCGALWFLTFWSSGRAQAALWSQFGPAGAERQLALAALLSVVADSVVLLSWMSRTVEPDQQRLLVAQLSLEAADAVSKGNFWGYIALSLFQLYQHFCTFHPSQDATCGLSLNTTRDGDSTAFLDWPSHCLIAHAVKKFFLMSNLNV